MQYQIDLNRMTNDSVLPELGELAARLLQEASGKRTAELKFQNLERIQNDILNGLPSNDPESLLYGDEANPIFSGWTPERLSQVCKKVGLRIHSVSTSGAKIETAVVSGDRDFRSLLSGERAKHKLWLARKQARRIPSLLAARARSVFFKLDPKTSNRFNFGAGDEAYPGYTKVDWAGIQDVYDNLFTLNKIPDFSAEEIYTNHVLEHIPRNLVDAMLLRWRRVLKPGGKLRARMPDAWACVKTLGKEWKETDAARRERLGFPDFLAKEASLVGTLDSNACIQSVYGWSDSAPFTWDASNQHKSLWTPELTESRFKRAGFKVLEVGNLGTLNTYILCTT